MDWLKDWCKHNPRLCEAVRRCLENAAAAELAGHATDVAEWKITVAATVYCVQGAVSAV